MTTDRTSRSVVDALLHGGLLDPAREGEALRIVATTLTGPGEDRAPAPVRRRMAEIAGYVGAAFVVGAAILFLSTTWAELSLGEQVGLLLGSAAVLAVAGAGFVANGGGRALVAAPQEAVKRRLSSVLLTAAAGCTAFAVGLLLTDALANEELAVMLAALTGLAVVLVGYLVAPTTVGQLGAAVAAFAMIPSGLGSLHTDSTSAVPFGLLVLGLGAAWLVAAERGWWHEQLPARMIGCVLALLGAQIPVFDDLSWVGYVLTALVAAAAFATYVVRRAWPYLATGVVALTLAVPEALDDWFGGSLGAAGILLATGVTLLVAALAGLRLRQEVQEAHGV
jgi:hypothetical protein